MNKEELTVEIKKVREAIHQVYNTTKLIKCPEAGRELSLTITNTQLGKMWLGKTIKALNGTTPYPESRNPESKVIEKAADSHDYTFPFDVEDSVGSIKMLRGVLDGLIKDIDDIHWDYFTNDDPKAGNAILCTFIHSIKQLSEADMWLGMALGAIRDKAEATK